MEGDSDKKSDRFEKVESKGNCESKNSREPNYNELETVEKARTACI